MAANENAPSSILYADLKDLGCKNYDVALILMETDRRFGDMVLLDRIESRSQLSRYIVHVAPGEMSEAFFKDFTRSAPAVLALIAQRQTKGDVARVAPLVAERYRGASADAMRQALEAYGADGSVYRNALSHIDSLPLENEVQRALLFLMLFIVAGCTGDPHRAAKVVHDFAANYAGAAFRTVEASIALNADSASHGAGEGDGADETDVRLGLMRIVGGKLKSGSSLYPLATDAAGSIIGSLASGPAAITDVDADVSREHARIYRTGQHWYIVGLNSTNGTSVISGADKVVRTVEPPRGERPRGYEPEPMEILPSDTICLGASTRFMVMPIWGD
ncbi:MAG TPA: hypothetical protein DCP91_10720 [Eggerthellaceae bacterium]|nr:hypothetical protein [Eggerthellaceae bacterium]